MYRYISTYINISTTSQHCINLSHLGHISASPATYRHLSTSRPYHHITSTCRINAIYQHLSQRGPGQLPSPARHHIASTVCIIAIYEHLCTSSRPAKYRHLQARPAQSASLPPKHRVASRSASLPPEHRVASRPASRSIVHKPHHGHDVHVISKHDCHLR